MVNKTVFQASIWRKGRQRAHLPPFKGTSAYISLAKTWSYNYTDLQGRLKNVYFSKVCPAKLQVLVVSVKKKKKLLLLMKKRRRGIWRQAMVSDTGYCVIWFGYSRADE